MRLLLFLLFLAFLSCSHNIKLEYIHKVFEDNALNQRLFSGKPETWGVRAGRVVLEPQNQMHRHSTKANEEVIIPLSGVGQVIVGEKKVSLKHGEILYIPPYTEHEVINPFTEVFHYIYVVSPIK